MSEPFRIGIAGLGTVGVGVVEIIHSHADLLAQRCGRALEITCVSARTQNKDRGIDLSSYEWIDQTEDLADYKGLDAVIELIGGSEGVALNLTRKALSQGVSVITANKAMVAHHGAELAALAEQNNCALAYEAAVAGGVPVIKGLREGLAANKISGIYGILNGTCNYILTQMRTGGRDFADVLVEAQDKGYAEADPAFDIEGVDAGHKLAILSAIAFGTNPDFEGVDIKGITHISCEDINFATELGYKIKLLGIARAYEDEGEGGISQTVEPCLVPAQSPLGAVEDVYNAVSIEGDFVETPFFSGLGAGRGATASSVVADIVDLARGLKVPTFGVPAAHLKAPIAVDRAQIPVRSYMRLAVLDKSGVIADISAILRDRNVSIESFIQRGRDPGQKVSLVMTLHEASYGEISSASDMISKLDAVLGEPCLIRIEDDL